MNTREVIVAVISLTIVVSVTNGQRPEFTPGFWAQKRLPDSMKGLSPEDLAVLAQMNEKAKRAAEAKAGGNQAPQNDPNVRAANGSYNMATNNGPSRVVQTGAATPVGPVARIAGGLRGNRPQAPAALPTAPPPRPGQVGNNQVPPQSAEVPGLLQQAVRAKQNGQLTEARDAYRKILKIEPYNREVLIKVARVEHAMGEIDNAIQAYDYLLKISPNHPVGLNDRGLCYARKGEFETALSSLQGAVVANPRSELYRNNLAKVLIETNRLDAAVHVVAQLRGDAMAKARVGALLCDRGRNAEGRDYLERAVAADPNLTAAREKLASLGNTGPVQVASRPESVGAKPVTIQATANELQIGPPELPAAGN